MKQNNIYTVVIIGVILFSTMSLFIVDGNGNGFSIYEDVKEGNLPFSEERFSSGSITESANNTINNSNDIVIFKNNSIYESNEIIPIKYNTTLTKDYDVTSNEDIIDEFNFIHPEKPVNQNDSMILSSLTDDTNDGFINEIVKNNNNLTNNQKNIFINLKTDSENTEIPISILINTHIAFQNAPIEYNHTNKTGINIQFYISNNTLPTTKEINSQFVTNKKTNISTYGYGYHNVFFVEDNTSTDSNGFAAIDNQQYTGAVVETNRTKNKQIGSTFMHEIGHLISLEENVFKGIDSEKYSFIEYPSIMNYNYHCTELFENHCYTFSDNEKFNDWEYIQNNYQEFIPNLKNLYE